MSYIPGVTLHARQRMAERMGRDLTRDEWLGAVAAITGGQTLLLHLHPDGVEQHLYVVGGMPVRLVWCPTTAQVLTVNDATRRAAACIDHAREGRTRKTFKRNAHFHRGKRMKARTEWGSEA